MMQLENEIKEQEEIEPYSSAEDDEVQNSAPEPLKRGRPKIPSKWTNVLKLEESTKMYTRVKDYFVDASVLDQQHNVMKRNTPNNWKLLFYPKKWA